MHRIVLHHFFYYRHETEEDYVRQLAEQGVEAVNDKRTRVILDFALKVNRDAKFTTDADIDALRVIGLTDLGIVQLVHLVSDFASYNRLTRALQTDYEYRDIWREAAFGWKAKGGEPEGENTRGQCP